MINLLFIFLIIFFIFKENNLENFKLKDISKIGNETVKMLKEIPVKISKLIDKKMNNIIDKIVPSHVKIILTIFIFTCTISSLIIIYKSLFGSKCLN
jgi:hypothetical protein|tara:strand:- start:255 stop:545 length:291 start_codon:yes stop_codon:yes gene_type:complete